MTIRALLILLFLNGAVAANELSWYEMSIPWNKSIPAPIDMSSRVLDAPAGKHGYIQVTGDKLKFEDDTPARFWGVTMSFTNKVSEHSVPPPKHAASVIAKKIASLGFNHVRFIGLDGHASGPVRRWLGGGEFEGEIIDRLDYFVNELVKNGIYYSFSINNSSAQLFPGQGIIRSNANAKYKYLDYYNVRLFDDASRKHLSDWVYKFFSHLNPYTKKTYATDPANIYFSAVNEDTAFLAFFRANKQPLDDYWVKKINKHFEDYLVDKYGSKKAIVDTWGKTFFAGIDGGTDLERIALRSKIPGILSKNKIIDTATFLQDIDMKVNESVKGRLMDLDYKGLFTGTNKWYGYGNLSTSYIAGNYIEMHAYFGSGRWDKKKKSVKTNEYSFIDKGVKSSGELKELISDHRFGLSRILPSHLIDRPYILSEWNHYSWNDTAYEGAYFINAYAARNGIDGLNVLSYFNQPQPNYTVEHQITPLAVTSNPLMLSILPTLSLAYLRGDIDEIDNKEVVCIEQDEKRFQEIALGLPVVSKELSKRFVESEIGSVRAGILQGCSLQKKSQKPPVSEFAGAANVLRWEKADKGGVFAVNTGRYKAAVGDLTDINIGEGLLEVNLERHGSLSLISLDDNDIVESDCLLMTVGGAIRNSSTKWHYEGSSKVITDTGHGKTQLSGNSGAVTISVSKAISKTRKIYKLVTDGGKEEMPSKKVSGKDYDKIIIELADLATPWLIIGDKSCF